MKQLHITLLLTMLMSLVGANTFAHDFVVNGVCYKITSSDERKVKVTYWYEYPNFNDENYQGNIVIPETVTHNKITYQVTSIGERAFENSHYLKSISIPNSIVDIGNDAFEKCYRLTNVIIPNSVASIGDRAFSKCRELNCVTIGNNVTNIGAYAFEGCKLLSVVIPNSVKTIGYRAFDGCNLVSITIGTGVTYLSDAFWGVKPAKTIWLCNTLPTGFRDLLYAGGINYVSKEFSDIFKESTNTTNTLVYPYLSSIFEVDGIKYVPLSPSDHTCMAIDCIYNESYTEFAVNSTVLYKGITMNVNGIGAYSFYGNPYLKNFQLGCTADIADYEFAQCTSLNRIVIPNNATTIGNHAFEGCTSLEHVKIDNDIMVINTYAFSGCISLRSISIPKAVTDIKNYVFSGCTGLKAVIIEDREAILNLGSNGNKPLFNDCPLDEVYIGGNISYGTSWGCGYSPFYRNASLRSVIITDRETDISENEFYGCTNLKNVSIGDGVETIGNWAFSGCSSLDYFDFGSALKTIGKEAFSDCTALTRIISHATTPPTCGEQALDDINKWNCTLQVPKGTLATYQAADQWKEFFFTEEYGSTNIVQSLNKTSDVVEIINLGGQRIEAPRKGVNIVKMNDGTVKKIVIK